MLLQSRKFWIMLIDVIVSLVAYFTGKYTSPETSKDILFLIGSLQPIILLVVGSITAQNIEGIKAAADVEQAKAYAAVENKVT